MQVKRDLLKYKLDDFLNDKDFVKWVLFAEDNQSWEKHLQESAELRERLLKAKSIIEILKVSEAPADYDLKKSIWDSIHNYEIEFKSKKKIRRLWYVLRYAAFFVGIITLGGLAFWFYTNSKSDFAFSFNVADASGEAKIILNNGNEVDLGSKDSHIEIKDGSEVLVNEKKVLDLRDPTTEPAIKKLHEVIIPYGRKSHLILPDGSKVWLNAGTRFAFPDEFTGNTRQVFLEGEAYFEVASIPDRAFIVRTEEIAIKVLGTRFNIISYEADQTVETILLEGSVIISENRSPALLANREIKIEPNQLAVFQKTDRRFNIRRVSDAESYIAWKDGWFVFTRVDIPTILNKMEKFYDVRFILEGEIGSADRISGKMDLKESITDVVKVLSDLSGLDYRIDGRTITVSNKQ